MLAASRGDAESVRRLLTEGADPISKRGMSPDGDALGRDVGERRRGPALVAAGADVNAEDFRGRTPLWWARRRGETNVVRLLEKAGAIGPASRPAPEPKRPTGDRRRFHQAGGGPWPVPTATEREEFTARKALHLVPPPVAPGHGRRVGTCAGAST